MDKLDTDILSLIFNLLDQSDILNCARVCRHLHHAIRGNTKIQFSLVNKFHSVSPTAYQDLPHRERIDHIQGTHHNLISLRPVITSLNIPNDHELVMTWKEYIITRPLDTSRQELETTGKETICTLWKDGIREDIKLPFHTDRETFAIDPDQDVIIVKELVNKDGQDDLDDDSDDDLYNFPEDNLEEYLHAYRLFNDSSDPLEYSPRLDITDDRYEGRGEQKIRILKEGRIILQEYGVLRMYDWRTWHQVARFPPAMHGIWGSMISWVITSNNLLVAIDLPTIMNDRYIRARGPISHEFASLAVFNLENLHPRENIAWTPDLLLEIPLGPKSLAYVVRSLDGIHKYSNGIEIDDPPRDQPILQETNDPKLLSISMRVKLNSYQTKSLKIVFPVDGLKELMKKHKKQEFAIEDDVDYYDYIGIWQQFDNPFRPIKRIAFFEWRYIAHVSIIDLEIQEIQHALYSLFYDSKYLKEEGCVDMNVFDYNPYNFIDEGKRVRLGRLGSMKIFKLEEMDPASIEKEKIRTKPEYHNRTIELPITHTLDNNPFKRPPPPAPGHIHCRAGFQLDGEGKGKGQKTVFDGKRLVIQVNTAEEVKLWIFDFGI